jgi:hypothetical protein
MEGTSVSAWQHAGMATDSSVEKHPEAGRQTRHPRGDGAALGEGSGMRTVAGAIGCTRPTTEASARSREGPLAGESPATGSSDPDGGGIVRRCFGIGDATAGRSVGAFGRRIGGPAARHAARCARNGFDGRAHVAADCGGGRRHASGRETRCADNRIEHPMCPIERGSVEPATPPGDRWAHAEVVGQCAPPFVAVGHRSEPHFGGGRTVRGDRPQ